uniref:Serpentine receptor class r-10 n=1 Tax=Caenorhabditis tropicalis TaxID=1561998 RepID=A0A1I7T6L8_9PELO
MAPGDSFETRNGSIRQSCDFANGGLRKVTEYVPGCYHNGRIYEVDREWEEENPGGETPLLNVTMTCKRGKSGYFEKEVARCVLYVKQDNTEIAEDPENIVYKFIHHMQLNEVVISYAGNKIDKKQKCVEVELGRVGLIEVTEEAGYTFLHAAIMSLLSVQFVYRYWAIFDNRKLYLFKGPYNLIWILYCSFFGLQYSLGNFFFLAKDKVANDYLRKAIQDSYNVNIENLPGMCVLPYDPVDGSIRWWNLMGVFNIMAIVNLQYSLMTFCGYSMHLKMEDKIKNFSEALRKHHKQFFKTLVLQVTMPTIILFIPITIIICLPLFNLDVNIPFGVVQCSFTLYPAADSIIIMYVVSEYRVTAKITEMKYLIQNVHNYKASSLFFSFDDSLGLSNTWAKDIPLAGYTFLHSAIMSLLSVQFIYRYWAVFDTRKLYLFKGRYNLIWILYCSFFGLQYSFGIYFFLEKDKTVNDYLRKVIQDSYNVKIEDLPGMCVLPYDPVDGSIRWWNLMGVFNIMAIVNLQYSIMTFCGYSMHSKMEDKIKNFSEALRKHHKQFFKTLVLQVTMPTIILFIPITIIICLPLFNLDISIPSGFVLCSFTLYPAADSIIVMYVVSEYRVTAKKFQKSFTRSFGKSESTRVGAVSFTSVAHPT